MLTLNLHVLHVSNVSFSFTLVSYNNLFVNGDQTVFKNGNLPVNFVIKCNTSTIKAATENRGVSRILNRSRRCMACITFSVFTELRMSKADRIKHAGQTNELN